MDKTESAKQEDSDSEEVVSVVSILVLERASSSESEDTSKAKMSYEEAAFCAVLRASIISVALIGSMVYFNNSATSRYDSVNKIVGEGLAAATRTWLIEEGKKGKK